MYSTLIDGLELNHPSLMNKRYLACLAVALFLEVGRSFAGDQSAWVRESRGTVLYGPQQSKASIPARVDTRIPVGDFIQTKSDSLAELLLPSQSVARIGQNTIFNYSVDTNTVDLDSGTILFCKPTHDGVRTLKIKTAAVTAGITGTTGFISFPKDSKGNQPLCLFGLIEGTVTAHDVAHGKNITVHAGQILEIRLGAQPFLFNFDIPRMVKTSVFFKSFKRPLPNEKEIQDAIAKYDDDVSRGFIGTSSKAVNYTGAVPTLPSSAFDSAQNAQSHGNQAPPPPSNPRSPFSSGP